MGSFTASKPKLAIAANPLPFRPFHARRKATARICPTINVEVVLLEPVSLQAPATDQGCAMGIVVLLYGLVASFVIQL